MVTIKYAVIKYSVQCVTIKGQMNMSDNIFG